MKKVRCPDIYLCQYGDRCKFLHVTQQQAKSNLFGFGSQSSSQLSQASQQTKPNLFGFGSQSSLQLSQGSQQIKPNPFGFGTQDTSQLIGANSFGARNQNPSKPFENKWIRSTAATNSTSSQQADTQKQAAVHECTDPESCKRQIVDDLKNETPLWKLTCYGHRKDLPCDIVGDFSYEELRATAYEDAKRGLTLQSIVERERNLLNSKIAEFDNLLRNPYIIRRSGPNVGNQILSSNTLTVSPLSSKPPAFSSFSQLGASTSVAPIMSFGSQLSGTPSNTVFGQSNFPKNTSQISGQSATKFDASGTFMGKPPVQQFGSSPGPINFGRTNGTFGGQLPLQQFGSSPGPSNSSITNGFMGMESEGSPLLSISPQFLSRSSNESSEFLGAVKVGQSAVNPALAVDKQDIGAEDTIWSKEWDIGEIPEEAPPERVCVDIKGQTLVR